MEVWGLQRMEKDGGKSESNNYTKDLLRADALILSCSSVPEMTASDLEEYISGKTFACTVFHSFLSPLKPCIEGSDGVRTMKTLPHKVKAPMNIGPTLQLARVQQKRSLGGRIV